MAADHGVYPSPGGHDVNGDPALQYLPRIEPGSPAAGTASDGGDRGATILLRHGASSTLWGEAGFDQPTAEPLWPFPNEAQIKRDMSGYEPRANEPAGQRGFCAPGNGLYGGPIILTSYIWEYLGNACPAAICSGGGATGTGGTSSAGGVDPDLGSEDSGGCGCRVAGHGGHGSPALLLLAAVGALGMVRRSRPTKP